MTHVGLDLSHSTNPLALVQDRSARVDLCRFGTCTLFGHDCAAIPRLRSVQVAATDCAWRSCIVGYNWSI